MPTHLNAFTNKSQDIVTGMFRLLTDFVDLMVTICFHGNKLRIYQCKKGRTHSIQAVSHKYFFLAENFESDAS